MKIIIMDEKNMSEKKNLVDELINKIQANHSLLTLDESDKFRIIFDHSKKNNYITYGEVIWLQQIAGRFNEIK